MTVEAAAGSECDLLLFEAAGQTFAADPVEIIRVDRPGPGIPSYELVPCNSGRVLIGRNDAGEYQVPVDRVLGVRRFSIGALRRPPQLAQVMGGPRADEVMGVVLDGIVPVWIVDLSALAARNQAPAAKKSRPPSRKNRRKGT